MKDQVDALVLRGVNAANLDSTLSQQQSTNVKNGVLSGSIKILYVAPERCESAIYDILQTKTTSLGKKD
jgi:superfamily II DNA helicase RecQ